MVSNDPQSNDDLPLKEPSGEPIQTEPVEDSAEPELADALHVAEPSDEYYEIRIVTRDIPVRVEYAAIRALRTLIRGKETLFGLLRGTRSLDAFTIDEFELLPAEAAPCRRRKLLRARR